MPWCASTTSYLSPLTVMDVQVTSDSTLTQTIQSSILSTTRLCGGTASGWRYYPKQKQRGRHVNQVYEMERRLAWLWGGGRVEVGTHAEMSLWTHAEMSLFEGAAGVPVLTENLVPWTTLGDEVQDSGLVSFLAQTDRIMNEEKHDWQGWGWIWKKWHGLILLWIREGGVQYWWSL